MSSGHYESAAKDLEQEKKMVAALKRLSIGNRMTYDPDLPPEDGEFIAASDWSSERSPPPSRSPLTSPQKLQSDENDTNDTSDDVNPQELLWVPAKMHPEVDPELFKLHVRNAVEEVMERKMSRKLSRRSSLLGHSIGQDGAKSTFSSPEESQTPDSAPTRTTTHKALPTDPRKRFSNPSLHQLSSELESLSRMAGMDANDAVTLARTLLSSSLGYTDSERLAMDELTLPPRSREPTQKETPSPDESQFPLKRSRRLDYRKHNVATGSNLQNNKAGKLAELRSNLNSALQTTVPTLNTGYSVPKARKKHHRVRNNRDSQTLFLYRKPNEKKDRAPLQNGPSLISNDSPYLTASSSQSIEKHFTATYHPQYRRLILGSLTPPPVALSPTPHHRIPSGHDRQHRHVPNNEYRPRQAPPPQPRNHPSRRHPTPPQNNAPIQTPTPQVTVVDTSSPVSGGLNKNLDLLRTEINEFKESLSVRNLKGPESPDSSDNNESDFSFEASYQDVSYEDSLGIELEVLRELNEGRDDVPIPQESQKEVSYQIQVPIKNIRPEQERAQQTSLSLSKEVPPLEEPVTTEEKQPQKPRSAAEQEPLIRRLSHVKSERANSEKKSDRRQGLSSLPMKKKNAVIAKPLSTSSPEKKNIPTQAPPTAEPRASDELEELAKISDTVPKKRSLKKKKSWPWMRERSVSLSSVNDENSSPSPPSRSVSTPEIPTKEQMRVKKKSESKELKAQSSSNENRNMISKLFRKKKTVKQNYVTNGVTVDYESDSDSDDKRLQEKKKKKGRKKLYSNLLHLTSSTLLSDDGNEELRKHESRGSSQLSDDIDNVTTAEDRRSEHAAKDEHVAAIETQKVVADRDMDKDLDSADDEPIEALTPTKKSKEKKQEVSGKSQSTLEVQEKIKRSIKRTSKANQPIEFTDSAFGFPLPPPSHSTLVMLDYRFPVHVERAIYRLSHLKLANPKRSLSEQVLLSNFMYAYLNLVDHTLHLEMAEELQGEVDVLDKEPDKLESDDFDRDTVMIDLDAVDG